MATKELKIRVTAEDAASAVFDRVGRKAADTGEKVRKAGDAPFRGVKGRPDLDPLVADQMKALRDQERKQSEYEQSKADVAAARAKARENLYGPQSFVDRLKRFAGFKGQSPHDRESRKDAEAIGGAFKLEDRINLGAGAKLVGAAGEVAGATAAFIAITSEAGHAMREYRDKLAEGAGTQDAMILATTKTVKKIPIIGEIMDGLDDLANELPSDFFGGGRKYGGSAQKERRRAATEQQQKETAEREKHTREGLERGRLVNEPLLDRVKAAQDDAVERYARLHDDSDGYKSAVAAEATRFSAAMRELQKQADDLERRQHSPDNNLHLNTEDYDRAKASIDTLRQSERQKSDQELKELERQHIEQLYAKREQIAITDAARLSEMEVAGFRAIGHDLAAEMKASRDKYDQAVKEAYRNSVNVGLDPKSSRLDKDEANQAYLDALTAKNKLGPAERARIQTYAVRDLTMQDLADRAARVDNTSSMEDRKAALKAQNELDYRQIDRKYEERERELNDAMKEAVKNNNQQQQTALNEQLKSLKSNEAADYEFAKRKNAQAANAGIARGSALADTIDARGLTGVTLRAQEEQQTMDPLGIWRDTMKDGKNDPNGPKSDPAAQNTAKNTATANEILLKILTAVSGAPVMLPAPL